MYSREYYPFNFTAVDIDSGLKHNIWCFCMLLGYNYQQKDFQRDKIMSTFDSEWRSDSFMEQHKHRITADSATFTISASTQLVTFCMYS